MSSKASDKVSPIRRQYLELKRAHQNQLLFFRLGDFYETFDEDAERVAEELDIVLTSRNVGKGTRVPMAGIPFHAMENYLARLIERGHHVAICEQVGTEPIDGLMPREVVRIVTPGTIVEPALLPSARNNYLAAVVLDDQSAGIAFVDITTGEFAATQLEGNSVHSMVRAELNRLRPAETLVPDDSMLLSENGLPGFVTASPAWHFETGRTEQHLMQQFETLSLDGFGMRDKPGAVRAAGGILQYLKDRQPGALKLLTHIRHYDMAEFMTLDATSRRNLELTQTLREGKAKGSLFGALDRTISPMGTRMLHQWVSQPLLDVAHIVRRQEGVTVFFDDGLGRAELRRALRPLGDLERLANRVVGGSALPRDLAGMRATLEDAPSVLGLLDKGIPAIGRILASCTDCSDELALLRTAIADEPPATLQHAGVFRPGYSEELDAVVNASAHAREWIAGLEEKERIRTGIKSLKVGYNKVFGYYIEVTRANDGMVPDDYIRKQTLVNAERYITPEMKEYENLVLNAEERIREIEARLFKGVCQQLAGKAARLLTLARTLAEIDCLAALAEVAALEGYVRPEMTAEDVLEIDGGRHPVVEHSLKGGERFVPNDARFEDGERIRIITGPNMSGKSTYLRQAALIVLMAQMGSYVPAKRARIGVVDRIFTRIGAQDEIHAGQSTFMVEMVEMANILNHATPRSLLVLDEVGRGTSTYDGLSIAWAVVEHLHNHAGLRSKTLFATHFHELTKLADLLPGVRNYSVAVSDTGGKVVFLHRIVQGGADKSYGIHVAQLAGLPAGVVKRADEILGELESSAKDSQPPKPAGSKQLPLMPEADPLVEAMKALKIDELSPMEALNWLAEWKARLGGRT
ncbi:MAG: DNA mismatch repair protein MutS [Anaerolineae bacterium]|nr:MAG: DNA mismatch repair protein MutS [Anaerolineae bacterium]